MTHRLLLLIALTLLLRLPTAPAQTTVLSPSNAVWKYLDNGSDQGSVWRSNPFNEVNWLTGTAPLGYGMTSITTTQAAGRITYYHRRMFTDLNPSAYSNLVVRLRRDDGGIVYLNGLEIFRSNMPTGAVNFVTLAASSISGGLQFTYFTTNVPPALLVAGTNLLAVEIHQASTNNVDGAFDLELLGQLAPCTPPSISAQPFGQTNCVGSSITFCVGANGTAPLSFQWRKSGAPIGGANGPCYTIPGAQLSDSGSYDVQISNSCGQTNSVTVVLVMKQCGPTITGISPLNAQMGDVITITGSGFDPVRANNCVVQPNGARNIPLRVVEASSNQLRVLVGPVPPDARPGPIMVAVGQGAEAAAVDTTDCQNCTKPVRIPWLAQAGEPRPPGVLRSLDLRPEPVGTSNDAADGTVEGRVGAGLGWVPLLPIWTFSTTSAAGLSAQTVSLIPTPAPAKGTNWVFSNPATNGGVSFVISNDCPALTRVQIQGDLSVTGQNGLGLDIIIPNLILNARLPAAACAQAICDLLVAAYEQVGIRIQCVVTPLGGNAAQITITVPGGSISSAGVMLCFSPAGAGLPAPFITNIEPLTATEGDLVTITGGNFGNNPENLCLVVVNQGRLIGMRALEATDDRVMARLGGVPSNSVAGPIGLARGIGRAQSITDRSNVVVSPLPAWAFATTEAGVVSPQFLLPIPKAEPPPPPPTEPVKKKFFNQVVNTDGTVCIFVDPNCPPGTKINIHAHFDLMDVDPTDGLDCPTTHIDTAIDGSWWHSQVFSGTGTGGDCADFVCQYLSQIFNTEYNTLFGACYGYPISCSANLTTGKLTINGECGCKLVNAWIEVEYCIPPPGGTPAPVITQVVPASFHAGELIQITGQNFSTDPDNTCAVIINQNRLIPLRVLTATATLLTVEVGPIPPDATAGPIGIGIGDGSVGNFQPAFADLDVSPAWFFSTTNVGVISPQTVTPIYAPPVSQTWYHSFLSNGQVYVFLPGPCPPGSKLIMDGHFDIRATNSPIRHADCWLPAVNFLQGGSALDCARRICDSFACGFFQRTGVRLNCKVIPQGNGALVCLGYPNGAIVNGGMTVCVRICDQPPVAPCLTNSVFVFAHGTTNDNFAGAEAASPRPELTAWLTSVGINTTRGYDDNGIVNRVFADSFANLPDCITKATLRIRLRANADFEENDSIMLAFAGAGGVLDPVRWSSYIGAGNPGAGVLNYTWISPSVAELVLDLSRLPLGNNLFKDLIPTLCAKKYLDIYVQDDTSVDYAVLQVESCRCRQDIIVCTKSGANCAPFTYAQPVFTDLCCPNQPGMLQVSCVPPSGTCFPLGTNIVHCTATDVAGRRSRCCFRVIVQPPNPPIVCANPTILTFTAGTTNDNFAGPEAASPSAGLIKRLNAAGVSNFKGFDSCGVNSFFAHTFTNLPSCIVEATLRIRVQACGDICRNDGLGLSFTAPNGSLPPGTGWGRYLGNGNAGGVGLFNTPWTAGTTREITLDLSALPNVSGSTTDLIPTLNAQGLLDVVVQDDSGVDFVELIVKSCCCRPDIFVNTATNQCCTVVTYTPPPFTNNCPPINVVCTPASGTCFPVGVNLVECKATDSQGQMGRCFFKVVVRDATPPVIINCPTNIVACTGTNNNSGVMPDLINQVVATDNCTPSLLLLVTQNPAPGTAIVNSTPPPTVTFTVTDAAGNSSTCTRAIVVAPCCVPPPRSLVLWLPFDEQAGFTAINAAGGNNGVLTNGPTRDFTGYVLRSLCFDGVNDFVEVPDYPAINIGTNDFTVDAWVKPVPNENTIRIIVDHRQESTNVVGYSLFLGNGNNLGFQIGDGAFVNYPSSFSVPADNQWHFVAVTVNRRLTNGIRFYLDGVLDPVLRNPTSFAGSITPPANYPLRVSSRSSLLSGFFHGCIDEVEVFRRALPTSEIQALFNARFKGKCKSRCSVPWDTALWAGSTSSVITATICNPGSTPQTYQYSFRGLPPGPRCSYPGPTAFSPAAGSITVAPGGCVSFPVTIAKPAGMPCGAIACFQMVIAPVGSTEQFSCEGSLFNSCNICATPITPRTNVLDCRVISVGPWTLQNSTATAIDLTGTRFTVFGPDMQPDTRIISLNGLPPGVPWEVAPGTILPAGGNSLFAAAGPGSGVLDLPLDLQFLDFDPNQTYTILLEADTDGDGEFEPLASMEVVNFLPGPGLLNIVHNANGTITVTWPDGWILQESPTLPASWGDVNNATNPYTVPALGKKFFRLRQ